jgi:hypothetical protein
MVPRALSIARDKASEALDVLLDQPADAT